MGGPGTPLSEYESQRRARSDARKADRAAKRSTSEPMPPDARERARAMAWAALCQCFDEGNWTSYPALHKLVLEELASGGATAAPAWLSSPEAAKPLVGGEGAPEGNGVAPVGVPGAD